MKPQLVSETTKSLIERLKRHFLNSHCTFGKKEVEEWFVNQISYERVIIIIACKGHICCNWGNTTFDIS